MGKSREAPEWEKTPERINATGTQLIALDPAGTRV